MAAIGDSHWAGVVAGGGEAVLKAAGVKYEAGRWVVGAVGVMVGRGRAAVGEREREAAVS